jgi:hypothetical protein
MKNTLRAANKEIGVDKYPTWEKHSCRISP